MDKYFYILVGLIWLVSNFYKSSQKKEAAKPVQPADGKPADKRKNIETILEEILTGEPQPQKEIVRKPKTQKPIKVKREQEPAYSQESLLDETTAEVRRSNTFSYDTPLPKETEKKSPEPTISIETLQEEATFDLKSAVIYSEIIAKPKYLSDI